LHFSKPGVQLLSFSTVSQQAQHPDTHSRTLAGFAPSSLAISIFLQAYFLCHPAARQAMASPVAKLISTCPNGK